MQPITICQRPHATATSFSSAGESNRLTIIYLNYADQEQVLEAIDKHIQQSIEIQKLDSVGQTQEETLKPSDATSSLR